MTKTKTDRNAVLEAIKAKYGPRIEKWMNALRDELIKIGALCDKVADVSFDNYNWSLDLSFVGHTHPNYQNGVDLGLSFSIDEQMDYDGEEGEYGVTFSFRGIYWGGRVFGVAITPSNYTDGCWVDMNDANAVESRFREVESNSVEDLAELIKSEWETSHEAE